MRKGIDHLVLAVRDLGAARDRFDRLGFRTTPMGTHPWGTANHIVQFPHNFIELLGVVNAGAIEPMSDEHFSFGAFNEAFLGEREGMSMLVLTTDDARADAERWRSRGLRVFEPFHWSRKATLPDATVASVAFTLTFVVDPRMPGIAFFSCQQHNPEFFWKPEYQVHANGATRISAVSMVSPDPSRQRAFFEALVDNDAVDDSDGNLEVALDGGFLRVQPLAGRAADARGARDSASDCSFVAATIEVADVDVAARCLENAGIAFSRHAERLRVAADQCFGVELELAPAAR